MTHLAQRTLALIEADRRERFQQRLRDWIAETERLIAEARAHAEREVQL